MKVLLVLREQRFELCMLLISPVRRFAARCFLGLDSDRFSFWAISSPPSIFCWRVEKIYDIYTISLLEIPSVPPYPSISLLQMCIGSYNFRITLVNGCYQRLPSVVHKTANCIPLHLYIFDIPFHILIQIFILFFDFFSFIVNKRDCCCHRVNILHLCSNRSLSKFFSWIFNSSINLI